MRKLYTPHEYQRIATAHIFDVPRCAVWASMGMGKTSPTLTALDALWHVGAETKPALVLAPLRVAASTWPDECAKWQHLAGLEVSPIIGDPEERLDALHKRADIYTMNYDNLPWLVETCGDAWKFGPIVPDESTRLKNARPSDRVSSTGKKFTVLAGGIRARALAQVSHLATRFIELTGTPAPNGLADLWGQMWFIDRGKRLGRTFEGFSQRYFRLKRDGYGLEALPYAMEHIQAALKDVCLTLDAADWFDVEKPIINYVEVDLPPAALKTYKDMERDLFAKIEGYEVEAFSAAARTIKCLQIANGAAFVEPIDTYDAANGPRKWKPIHDAKLDALESIIEEAAGMPVLVGYHFRPDLMRLQKRFPKGRVLDKNSQTVRDWNTGKIPILFAHPASAGHGLNLADGGNILVFFAHWWDGELHDQFIERIGSVRQLQAGHARPVFIYYIVARRTIDRDVIECVREKGNVQDTLKSAMRRLAA